MSEILGKAKTIRELLNGQKYAIDYYQRDYKWESKQVAELIDDLSGKFLETFDPAHDRSEVEKYGHYFLGSIIVSSKNGQKYLIDGQQRLTTLTLFLIFLNNLQCESASRVPVNELIYSERFSKKSFNLNVEERISCMESIFNGQEPNLDKATESVQNIATRYREIGEYFPESLKNEVLPYFIDWLLENVHFVEITAYSDEDAYTIFETMNDRGLSLTPTDMLKGYLLANITDEGKRSQAAEVWKNNISDLQDIEKEEDADFFKAWLRSQYANTIRERKRGAQPGDFDRLGTEFHRWIRDNKEELGLSKSEDFFKFITRDMAFYANWYLKIRKASFALTSGLEEVYYNARHEFNVQYPIILASIKQGDDDLLIVNKIRKVASFIDILIARRISNYKDISASSVQYAMFLVMRDIRGKNLKEMSGILTKRLQDDTKPFSSSEQPFALHGMNRKSIHRILARITDYIERESGMPSRYVEYATARGTKGYEVEHIWADHPERHKDEFTHPADFQNIRNRFGGLLLLPKNFNQSYSDLPYEKKLDQYFSQNLLVRSLHSNCYERNPGFLAFMKRSGLPFKAHLVFKKSDNAERQGLYCAIAERIWNLDRLKVEAGVTPE
jgi:uncharacterized protein with ParB-like and HNH nuclease domain